VRTIFYKKMRQNPQILKSRVSEILMKSQSRRFNQVSVSTVTVSTASLWITHCLQGHSYTEAKWGTCLDKLSVMLPQNIFVELNQIILYCMAVLKTAALQLHYVATTKAGDVINIFASVKFWLWLWPCFELWAFLCAKLLNNFLYLCWCVVIFNLLACGKQWRCQLKLHCLTHFRGLFKLPNVAYNSFWLILKWLYMTFFAFLQCTIQGGPKLDVLLTVFLQLWLKFRAGIDQYWIVPVRKLFYFHHR